MRNILKITPCIALLVLLLAFSVLAVPTVIDNNPSSTTTSSKTFLFNYTIRDLSFDLSGIKYIFNNTNYSIYDDSLVLFYNFDNRSSLGENDSKVVDLSKYSNNGTVIGGSNISWTSGGKYNGAYNFSGNRSYINRTALNEVSINKNFTVSLWIKATSMPQTSALFTNSISTNDRFGITINSNTLYTGVYNGASYTSSIGGTLDTNWNNVVVVYNSSTVRLFINNVEKSTAGTPSLSSTVMMMVGARTGGDQNFNGTIDDLKIWNRTLSSSEIQNNYNSYLTKYDVNNWSYLVNQSLGTYTYNFGLCSSNPSTETCASNSITRNPVQITLSSSIGTIPKNFYGMNDQMGHLSDFGMIDVDGDGVLDTKSDTQLHRNLFTGSKVNQIKIWLFLDHISISEGVLNNSNLSTFGYPQGGIDMIRNEIAYANLIGSTTMIRTEGMPQWLQNRTSGYCNSTRWQSCSPLNNTKFAQMIVDILGNVTNNGQYQGVELEVLNEPYDFRFLNNLSRDNQTKANEYMKLYNETYNLVKSKYSSIAIGGPAGYYGSPNMLKTFITNMSGKFDFISIHSYAGTTYPRYITSNNMYNDVNNVLLNCTLYGVTCSRVAVTEWGNYYAYNMSSSEWDAETAFVYQSMLNNFPTKVTLDFEEWSERVNYTAPGYPNGLIRYHLIEEPLLDNVVYSPYTITKNFATYLPYGNTVVSCLTDDDSVKCAASMSPDGKLKSVAVINGDSEGRAMTIVSTETYSSISTGAASNTIRLGAYGVDFLYYQFSTSAETSKKNFCNTVTGGYSNFFAGVIVIFVILAVAIVIGVLMTVVKAVNGESTIIMDIFETFDVKAVMAIILSITILVWVIIVIFASLC